MYSVWEKLEKREKVSLMGIYATSLVLVWLLGYGWGRGSNTSLPLQTAGIDTQGNTKVIDLSQPPSAPVAPTDASTVQEIPTQPEVVVHVSGAVKHAGVYRLGPQSRIADALEQAGGASELADLDALNLAEPLQDGQKIYVPRKGETSVSQPATVSWSPARRSAPRTKTAAAPQFPINLNTATAEQLEALPGIGPALAQRIVEYRQMQGRFQSVDELLEVRGIGTKRLENIRPYVVVK